MNVFTLKFTVLSIALISNISLLAQVELENGLVAHYPFNGNANDESLNENNGLVLGASLTTDRFGNEESAYFFDGIDDYINVGNSDVISFPGTSPFSISLWFNTYSLEGRHDLLTKNNKEIRAQYIAWQNNDKVLLYRENSEEPRSVGSNEAILDSTWYHYLVTYDGSTATLYLNGVPSGQRTSWGNVPNIDIDVLIGASFERNVPALFFQGIIDDIRIYNRAIDEEEIDALFNNVMTNIETVDLFSNIDIFPNPTKGSSISFKSDNKISSYTVLSTEGKQLSSKTYSYPISQGNISEIMDFSKGLYFVRFKQIDGVETVNKIIIN